MVASSSSLLSDEVADRLITAAIETFAERGIEKAGVALIAERAGLTTGAIYNRWPGKQELLLDALDVVMVQEVAELLTVGPESQATDVLQAMGDNLLQRNSSSDAIVLEAVVMARRDPSFGAVFSARLADADRRLAALIDQGKAMGTIDASLSTPALAMLCRSMSLGFVAISALGQPLVAADEWNSVIDRLLAATAPHQSASPLPVPGKEPT